MRAYTVELKLLRHVRFGRQETSSLLVRIHEVEKLTRFNPVNDREDFQTKICVICVRAYTVELKLLRHVRFGRQETSSLLVRIHEVEKLTRFNPVNDREDFQRYACVHTQ